MTTTAPAPELRDHESRVPPVLTLAECAAWLIVSTQWLDRSDCPRIRHGRIVRFDRDAALSWFRVAGGLGKAA